MKNFIITGIQQVGIGVSDVVKAFNFYRKTLGFDIQIFDESAEANLMLPYTGGKPHQRRAILAINMNGGGGLEIWQYTSRTPQNAAFTTQLGDLGIFIAKIKSFDIQKLHQQLNDKNIRVSNITKNPVGKLHFYFQDIFGNYFEVIESQDFFEKNNYANGGICGAVIGVSDITKSAEFYKNVLGFDKLVYFYDNPQVFDDFSFFDKNQTYKRALLTYSHRETAGFASLFGIPYIELVEVTSRQAKKIFENRYWGDLGFIHLCFDVKNMAELKKHCEKNKSYFTVDSGEKFSMGEAAGHFAYIEDPDGTLIEFVETKKVPILKKLNWYWKFSADKIHKPVPKWMIKAFKFNRVKSDL